MTDRLIRIGSGTFCQARNLKPGDVFKFIGEEYTIERLWLTLSGDVQFTTKETPHLWTLNAQQEVTIVRAREGA